jgi:hypothetical protein
MTVPIRDVPIAGELLATCRTLQDVVDLFRLMKERLGLTNDFCDDVGGLTKGHTDKVLGRSETKRLGYDTFALYTLLTAVEFRVYVDMDAVKRMEGVWEKRERPLFPNGKIGRVSKKVIEAAKPHVLRHNAGLGGLKRAALLTSKQRSQIAKKAARKSPRLRGLSAARRTEIARNAALAGVAKRKEAILAIAAAGIDCISDLTPAAS